MTKGPGHFFRATDGELLRRLFAAASGADVTFATATAPKTRATLALQALAALGKDQRARFEAALFEITTLANLAGEDCLRQAAGSLQEQVAARFLELRSAEDRAAWMWLEHRRVFDDARNIFFFLRRSVSAHLADAYGAPESLTLTSDLAPLERQLASILATELSAAPRVKIERFDYADGAILLSISHEELWQAEAEFEDGGELRSRARRRVQHAAARIESGTVTIVAERGGPKRRRAICDAIAEIGLGLEGELARLPNVTYDLQRLLDPAPFETDPADSIIEVMVTSLTVTTPNLRGMNAQGSMSGRSPEDVRERIIALFPDSELPFVRVLAAELRVVFRAAPDRNRRVARLKFSGPGTCRIDPASPEQTLVRARYLARWGLLGPRRAAEGMVR